MGNTVGGTSHRHIEVAKDGSNMKKEQSTPLEYTSNDELFPTEITFPGGLKIRLACSEDGQSYLKVEPALRGVHAHGGTRPPTEAAAREDRVHGGQGETAMISQERLRACRFFASLTDRQLTDIAAIGEEKSFPSGSIIFKENTTADNLMLLLEGGVELFYSGGGAGFNADASVCSIVPGGIFGVSSLIKPYQYTASARATKPVKVLDINGVMLREISEKNQALGRLLMNNVAAAVLARLH